MYAVVRAYSGQGAAELFDLLEQREEDVRALITGVPGFVSYAAFRSGDGGVTVTVCEDKAGTDESSRPRRSGSRKTSARQPTRLRSPRETRSSSSARRRQGAVRSSSWAPGATRIR
jgi:hypothetical protein